MSETKVPKKDSSSSKNIKRPRKLNPLPTKIVIRHLPPTLSSEQFVEQVAPISDHNYYYFVKGDPSLGEFSFSRAYINFINQEDILHFREKFDNYVFVDDKGNEYPAIVELALYQGVPKKRKKIDARCKTIENDPNFIQFIENKENLNKLTVTLPTVQECLEEIEAKEKTNKADQNLSTPLLEYLNNANKKQIDLKKKTPRDEKKKDENKRRRDRDRDRDRKNKSSKTKEWQSTELSSTIKSDGKESDNRENGLRESSTKEPRIRYRRRREERKLKSLDEKSSTKKTSDLKSSKCKINNSLSVTSKASDSSKTTFTVKILTNNDKRSIENESNKIAESGSKEKKSISSEKVRNKDRPSIQIYRPSVRLSSQTQSKDANKPSQEKSSSSRRN